MTNILKELRKSKGYTQEKLAKILGYSSKSGYSMLESGKVKLTISKAKALSDFYNVDIKIFL